MADVLGVLLAAGLIFLGCRTRTEREELDVLPGLIPPDVAIVELRRNELLEWAAAQRPLPGQPAASEPPVWRTALGGSLMRVGAWLRGAAAPAPSASRQALCGK